MDDSNNVLSASAASGILFDSSASDQLPSLAECEKNESNQPHLQTTEVSLDDTVYMFFLENLKRHVCNACATYDFKYYRHYTSRSVVVKDIKRCVRPDAVDNFENISGRLQYCPYVKYSAPKDKLFITILPDMLCHIDTALIGGIYEVLQTPVACYSFNGTRLNELYKEHNVVSTTGASFSQEFYNPCFANIYKCTYPNSIIYSTHINNAEWSLFYHHDESRASLFKNSIKCN